MIDGLGVVGWGVGGIEAEGVMLGQPIYMLLPEVVGMELTGKLPPGATATDLVLTVTEMLRKEKVVGKFVEFFGAGVSTMAVADRATIGNMSPEYGATMGFFPVDDQTLRYLRQTGRTKAEVDLVERYTKEQGLFRTDSAPVPTFTKVVRLDLSTVEPCLAGPKRPQDRIAAVEHETGVAQSARRRLRQAVAGERLARRPLGRRRRPQDRSQSRRPSDARRPRSRLHRRARSNGTAKTSTSSTATSSSPRSPAARTRATPA